MSTFLQHICQMGGYGAVSFLSRQLSIFVRTLCSLQDSHKRFGIVHVAIATIATFIYEMLAALEFGEARMLSFDLCNTLQEPAVFLFRSFFWLTWASSSVNHYPRNLRHLGNIFQDRSKRLLREVGGAQLPPLLAKGVLK
jgi:hypothetical protein